VARLTTANLPFVFKYSTIDNLPYNIAHDTDYSQYSMLVACGGDGTYHEVVNGMLARKDK
jgi:diacylglycerol kinase family enzyme